MFFFRTEEHVIRVTFMRITVIRLLWIVNLQFHEVIIDLMFHQPYGEQGSGFQPKKESYLSFAQRP